MSIWNNETPYFIAELSGNHKNDISRAIRIIDAALAAGVDAVKLQAYTADTLTIDSTKDDFLVTHEDSIWKNRSLYELYTEANTDWDWFAEIFEYCKNKKIDCFSSVFDETSVDFLEKLDPPCYKIASFENIHFPLIAYVAQTGRPLIISTGLATEDEIDEAVNVARRNGCKDLCLLKCTSDYPAKSEEANLATIPFLRKRFDVAVGLSDHTVGNEVSIAATAFGINAIEKHVTIDRFDGSVDSQFSTTPEELMSLISSIETVSKAVGKVKLGISPNEEKSVQFRRSIYCISEIGEADEFTEHNIKIIRPGFSLHPKYYNALIGKKPKKKYHPGDRIDAIELE